jgi:aryl-alcohol dehydrogenase-like predicted oxidoreductase
MLTNTTLMHDHLLQPQLQAVGVSNYSKSLLEQTHAALRQRGIPLASNQIQYSLLHRQPELSGLLATCAQLNVQVLAYSPLAQGLLTGKYTSGNMPTGTLDSGVSQSHNLLWDTLWCACMLLKQDALLTPLV